MKNITVFRNCLYLCSYSTLHVHRSRINIWLWFSGALRAVCNLQLVDRTLVAVVYQVPGTHSDTVVPGTATHLTTTAPSPGSWECSQPWRLGYTASQPLDSNCTKKSAVTVPTGSGARPKCGTTRKKASCRALMGRFNVGRRPGLTTW